MEYLFVAAAVLIGAVYVTVLIKGLEKNKSWAREIALTIALMEPSRGYLDYSYLRREPETNDDPDEPNECSVERQDRLAA